MSFYYNQKNYGEKKRWHIGLKSSIQLKTFIWRRLGRQIIQQSTEVSQSLVATQKGNGVTCAFNPSHEELD